MAIPEGRLSTTPIVSSYIAPDDRTFFATTSYEVGPIAIEDVTQGISYQDWTLTWDEETGIVWLTPETGLPVNLLTITNVSYITFTFDQNAQPTVTWVTNISSFLYWYDSQEAEFITTDLGVNIITPSVSLDDKRQTQNEVNDILLWYLKAEESSTTYALYMRIQRDRFNTEYLMAENLPQGFLHNVGMGDGLRVQILIRNLYPTKPVIPVDPYNLTFESGAVNWTQTVGTEWSINQNDPYVGSWNASLASTGAYSSFENDHYFPVTGNQSVTIKMFSKGTIGQGLAFGYATYDSNFAPIGGSQLGINVEPDWKEDEWTDTVAANAAYIRVTVQSNGQVGTYHVDNFSVIT